MKEKNWHDFGRVFFMSVEWSISADLAPPQECMYVDKFLWLDVDVIDGMADQQDFNFCSKKKNVTSRMFIRNASSLTLFGFPEIDFPR